MQSKLLARFSDHLLKLEHENIERDKEVSWAIPNSSSPQPIHVLYGGAHLFRENTFSRIFELSKESFKYAAPNLSAFSKLLNGLVDEEFHEKIYDKLTRQMSSSPLMDYRIDFEDGYGTRTDEDEDQHALQCARILPVLIRDGKAPTNIGIRIKPLSNSTFQRSLRTLLLFVEEFSRVSAGNPCVQNFIITLPKVTNSTQVKTLADILSSLESEYSLKSGFFLIELVIETPDALLPSGHSIALFEFVKAGAGRCNGIHFGLYDFSSSLGISSAGQTLESFTSDFTRTWMLIVAGTVPGLRVCDSIINRIPLTPKEVMPQLPSDYTETWRYNYAQITRGLTNGIYQGWDLHPSQLHIRHAANIAFFAAEFDIASKRLKGFLDKSAQANQIAGLFDDRASVLGLLSFFERAISIGYISNDELASTGIDLAYAQSLIRMIGKHKG